MKLLITGAKGQVGSELVKDAQARDYEVFDFGSRELDITNFKQLMQKVEQIRPDVIINAAAYTAVDKAEQESELAYAVNALGSENLAKASKQQTIPLLYISTDYVFDGEKDTPYTEMDQPNPTGVYGASKLQGDQAIEAIWSRHIILRVSWVFGEQGNNFVKTMLRLAEQRDELGIVNDQFGAPTSARAISQSLLSILEADNFNQPDFLWGTYHLQSEPGVTWFEFAREIFKQAEKLGLINKTMKLNPISSSEFPTPVKRPANSKLDGIKLKQNFALKPVQWQDDLQQMLKNMSAITS